MKKVKFTVAFLFTVMLISAFSLSAYGLEINESTANEYGEELYSTLDESTKEILSSFGIDSLDFDSVFDVSFTKSANALKDIFKTSVSEILPYFFKMLAMIIIITAVSDLDKTKSSDKTVVSSVFGLITVIMTASFISDVLSQMTAAFDITGKFLLTLAPIITAILSVSGNVTVSVLYNSVTVAAAQIISAVSGEILIPLIGVYFSFVISLDLSDTAKSERTVHSMNKLLTGMFTAMSTVFTFILSVKNVLAKELDGVLYKSGKYVISSFVPVVGSNISAILSSVIGSLDLIKSTVAVFGVICVAVINLPVIAKLSVCCLLLGILSTVSDFFSQPSASSILRGFLGGIKLLTAIIFFEVVLVIISLGLTVTIKGAS